MLMALFTHATGSMLLDTGERAMATCEARHLPFAIFNKNFNAQKH